MQWQAIDEMVPDSEIWVLKYDIYFKPDGNFTNADDPEAMKFTDCRGYFDNEQDALKVLRHFPTPNSYRIEKVRKWRLK